MVPWDPGNGLPKPTKELFTMGKKTASAKVLGKASSGHRKTKAALAAGAVASTVAATAAYRRRNARRPAAGFDAGRDAGPGETQPL